MPLSRRSLFKGLAAVAGLTVIAPRLILPSDPAFAVEAATYTETDTDYARWLADPNARHRYWPGVGKMPNAPYPLDYRTQLLAATELGRLVLYAEMLGMPRELWSKISPCSYAEQLTAEEYEAKLRAAHAPQLWTPKSAQRHVPSTLIGV